MADINAQIPLAGKPPVLPEFDTNKLYLTLGQLKYLQAETQRTEAQAALAGTQGQAAQAELRATERLRAIPTGAGPLPPPAAPLAAGVSPAPEGPAGGPPPAPRRLTTEELAAQYVAADPIKGPELAKALFANDKQALDTRLQHATFAANVFKDANNQAEWNIGLAYIEHVTGKSTEHLPQVFSPEAKAQMANVGRSVQQEIEQKNKEVDQRIAEIQAKAAERTAQTGAAAETRMNRKDIPVPMAEGPPARFREFGPDTSGQQGTPAQPDNPGMTLEQSNQRASHEAGLHGEFRNETEQYDRIRNGLALVRNASEVDPKDPRATDQVLLNGFAEVIGGASNPRLATVLNPEQRNSLVGRLEQYRDQLLKGASLSPGQRKDIIKTVEEVSATQIANYDKIKDNYRTRAKGIPNTRPEVIAPDFVQSAPGAGSAPQASGTAPVWTPANVAELKRGLIAAGNTPAQAEAIAQQIQRATPAPVSPSAPPTQGRVVKPGGVSGGSPTEVAAVIARFRAAGEPNPSMQQIRAVIQHAHENGLDLTGGTP